MPADPRPDRSALLAEVVRSGFVEGHHRGSVLALAADGSRVLALGDPDAAVFPRSSNKPMQAVGMLEAGLDLDGELLALACASHSGEPFHIEGVRRVLAAAGLDETALRTPPDWPVDEVERHALIAAGGQQAPILMNCSGKHAAMLATCVANGWPTDTYADADHPLQVALRAHRRAAVRREGAGRRRRRLRGAAVRDVPGRAGPLLRRDRHRAGRHPRAPGRAGHPEPPRVARRHPARRDPAGRRRPRADRQGRRRGRLRRGAARTAGPSPSRSTTAGSGPGRR